MLETVVDPAARVDPNAKIGVGTTIGPFCHIGPHVVLGDGCRLASHVSITGHTTVGARTAIAPFTSLGGAPQSVKYRGGPTRLIVGADCDIRENVTINTGTEDDRGVTQVGDRCFLMAGSHVAHDCVIGNDVTFANNVLLGGHVAVGDHVVFGGQAAVRQFVRIGEGAMIVGLSGVRADVIPFGLAHGPLANLVGLNIVGLRRRGISRSDLHRLRNAYDQIFFGADPFAARVKRAAGDFAEDPLVVKILDFISSATRPLTMATKRNDLGEAS
jgi:UDP-N-acetylglucosamine acyltransferase